MLGKLLTRRRLATGVGLLVAVALVVVACGGGGATATPRPPTTAPTATQAPTAAAPTATKAPTATPQPQPTLTPTPLPTATPAGGLGGLGSINKTINGWTWVANKPNWNVPPQRGGTFNYGFTSRPAGLDPILNRSFTVMTHAAIAYNQLLRCTLAPLTETGDIGICQPGPDLATSWTQSADGLTWTFKLDKNAKWQSVPEGAFGFDASLKPLYGRPFVAADVVHTVNYWKGKLTKPDGKPQGTPAGGFWSAIDSATAIDDNTVAIKTKVVDPTTLFNLADFQSRVVPPEVFKLDGDYTKRMVGTSAFILNKFENNGNNSEFIANPNFWRIGGDGKPLPYLDKYTFQVVSTSLGRSAMITGNLDSAQSIGVNTPSDVKQFQNDCSTCQIASLFTAQGVFSLGFRTEGQGAQFADIRARLAVAKAIDWKTFIQNVHEGAAIMAPASNATALVFDQDPTLDVLVKTIRDAGIPDDKNPYVFDTTLAKKLWADSGHQPGESVELSFTPLYGGALPNQFAALASVISQNLGVKAEVNSLNNFPSYYSTVGFLGGQPHQQFKSISLYFNNVFLDNAGSLKTQFTPGSQNNFAEFNNPTINALVAEISKGVPLEREKAINRQVFIEEQKDFRRLLLPTSQRWATYSGRTRNVYQFSRAGEAFHQGGGIIEIVWVAR